MATILCWVLFVCCFIFYDSLQCICHLFVLILSTITWAILFLLGFSYYYFFLFKRSNCHFFSCFCSLFTQRDRETHTSTLVYQPKRLLQLKRLYTNNCSIRYYCCCRCCDYWWFQQNANEQSHKTKDLNECTIENWIDEITIINYIIHNYIYRFANNFLSLYRLWSFKRTIRQIGNNSLCCSMCTN